MCLSKWLVLVSAAFFGIVSTMGQGRVQLQNKSGTFIDAPVTFLDGSRVGSGYQAQVFIGLRGTPATSLQPVFPTAPFQLFPDGRPSGYFFYDTLDIPGIGPGLEVTLAVRVFNGTSWETATCRGESVLLDLTLGGWTAPATPLFGLQPFSVNCIPEPGTYAIFAAGIGLFIATRQRMKTRSRS